MRVTELSVENFKKITSVHVKLGPHVTEISGANGAGKSSYIDALWVLLKGKKVAPAEPIRKGAERCRIRGRIGEYLVTRTFKRVRSGEVTTELRIERDNESMPPTEAFMRSLIGDHMLDPGDFISLSTDAKFDVFRSFVPGVDFKAIANQNRQDYERRTDVNRMAREANTAAHMISVPDDTPAALIDKAALIERLRQAGETNTDIERRRGNREKAVVEIARLHRVHADAPARMEAFAQERLAEVKARVAELEAEILRIREQIKDVQEVAGNRIDANRATEVRAAETAKLEADELQEKLDNAGALPEPIDTHSLAQRIAEAERTNDNVTKRQTQEKHRKTADRYQDEAAEITARMEAREQAKQDAIAAAKLPVPGITFGDGEVFLDGVPFDQASTAQKIRVGVAIAVAKNPQLRLVWIRDASLLDDRSYALVEQLAQEFDCQILLEVLRPIGGDAIILEDGHVKDVSKGRGSVEPEIMHSGCADDESAAREEAS